MKPNEARVGVDVGENQINLMLKDDGYAPIPTRANYYLCALSLNEAEKLADDLKQKAEELRWKEDAKRLPSDIVFEALRDLARMAYWYSKNTGDHDMKNIQNQKFFWGAENRIMKVIERFQLVPKIQ